MDLKQLFLQTNSANDAVRKNAEQQLKSYEKNVEFLDYVRNILMKDSDKIVQHITSIYFMVTIEKNWKSKELASIVSDLEANILNLLMIEDKYPKLTYEKVLHCIFENSASDIVERIFFDSAAYLQSMNPNEYNVALMLYDEYFKSDVNKYNSTNIMSIMFDKNGTLFTNKFTELIASRRYHAAAVCMKIISKAYSNYALPDFLIRSDIFTGYFHLALQILNIHEKGGESMTKLHRWAAHFLYKCSNKGIKKYFKDTAIINFIRSTETIELIYNAFSNLLNEYLKGTKFDERIPITIANFFSLFASNKLTRYLIKSNYMFLISSFILPIQSFDEETKNQFENDQELYLNERYNYYSNDLKVETNDLFEEIVHSDKEIESLIVSSLIKYLNNPIDVSNASTRYAIIGLLAGIQKSLKKQLGDEGYFLFVKQQIFGDLKSPFTFLISQSLRFLSQIETFNWSDNNVIEALSIIVNLSNGSNDILVVESCLALNCFFYNQELSHMFKPIIASLFEKILSYSKNYFIESLADLCDSIIECYTDDIAAYAPLFVQSICVSFMERIVEDKEEHISTISGYLATIEKLIMAADDKPDVVVSIFDSTSKIIFYIFQNKKFDFIQESFDLMNSFLFVLRKINQTMFDIFVIALSIDREELALYPREVADFIDNFLTFGKAQLINLKTLEIIYNIIDIFIPLNSSDLDIYDEDFEAGCRIIDSLMLNAGPASHNTNPNLIPALIHKIVSNYDFACTYDNLPLFALESIMNCFIVSPDITLTNLGSFTQIFFSDIIVHKNLFKRVYDKKLFILFTGVLFKITTSLPIDFNLFSEFFGEIITSLPIAIKKRNKMQEKAETDDYSEEENSDYDEIIFEDIYFITILDSFDAYEYSRNILSGIQANTIGEKILASMNQKCICDIKTVLDSPQEAQK